MAVYNVKWTIVEIKQLKMICISRAAAKSSNVNYTWLESSTACSTPLILNRNIISNYWDMHTCSITRVCTCMCQPTHSLCVPAHMCKHTYGLSQRGSAAVLFHNIRLFVQPFCTRPAWSCCSEKFVHLLFCYQTLCIWMQSGQTALSLLTFCRLLDKLERMV